MQIQVSNVRILASKSVPIIPTTVQVSNIALTETKRTDDSVALACTFVLLYIFKSALSEKSAAVERSHVV
jgi:hypothetical protein